MISKIDSPAFYLILWVLLLAIVPQSHAQQPSVPPQEGDTLDNVTISEAEARNIMKGLFDLPRLTHSLALGRIAKDERLTAFNDGFMQRNNIQVLTIGYIDSDEFWPRIFRQQRLGKINKANNDNLLAAKIIFVPVAGDGAGGYTTTLELTGKTSQVYELLSISQAEVDSIAASTSQQQLGNTTFATPNEAKETVVSALIAALQRVELKASPQDALALVTFQAAPADDTGLPTYGFDQMVYEQLAADYPTATIAGQTVRTAWKSLKSNAPDKVTAVAAGDVTPVFQMDGVALTATPGNANTYKVSLMGASDGNTSELLALTSADNGQTMGLLNTISYDEEHTSLKIVPVNGAGSGITQAALQNALNDIYASAIATWYVEVLPGVQLGMAWDEDGDGKLNDGETGMLSNYTGEMNAMIAEFRKNHDRQKDAYYIFLVDQPKTPNKLGYMPRKKQWGFVFAGNHTTNVALTKTIAHELGHGVFRLEHTFSEKGLPQSQTNNLMDYTPIGTTLYKYQWDYVHDPVNVVTLFDDDDEASLYDCPRWFGTDEECESVGWMLDKIKEAAGDGSDLITKGPITGTRDFSAENILLDGTEFTKIRIINMAEAGQSHQYSPQTYQAYEETFLTTDGTTDVQRGFVFRFGESSVSPIGTVVPAPVILKILIYENHEALQEKIDALESYLFGDIPGVIIAEITRKLRKDELTAAEIKALRERIAKVEDADKRKEFYLKLQTRVAYASQMLNTTQPYVTCNQTSLSMCLEGLGIQNPDSTVRFADYLENYRAANNLGSRTVLATREKEIKALGADYEEIDAIDKNFDLLKSKLLPHLEVGHMITFSMGNHIVRLVEIDDSGIIVDDPYGCLPCKTNLLERQSSLGNVYCSNTGGHASCCTGTQAYKSPCITNSIDDMSNIPGRHCKWEKVSLNELKIYNILVVKPESD
jgi:hypothetical protein